MPSLQKNWIAMSLMATCAIAGPCSAVAADMPNQHIVPAEDVPASRARTSAPLEIFTAGEDSPSTYSAQATSYQDWVAVDTALLDEMRGGFDLAPGLKVSIGIERIVNLNGILQTVTRIEVPDAGSLLQAQRSAGATASPAVGTTSGNTTIMPAINAKSGEAVSVPVPAKLGGGATALIQNGLGNMVTTGILSPEAAATVIQNNASNQTIQSVTVINASTNSLELLKGANLQSTLLDALTQTARSR